MLIENYKTGRRLGPPPASLPPSAFGGKSLLLNNLEPDLHRLFGNPSVAEQQCQDTQTAHSPTQLQPCSALISYLELSLNKVCLPRHAGQVGYSAGARPSGQNFSYIVIARTSATRPWCAVSLRGAHRGTVGY
jgi:hypothetical protein